MRRRDRKAELLQMETERWDEFQTLIDRVPAGRMEDPTLNEDGWSVKDLLHHMGCWDLVVARDLEQIREGIYTEDGWTTEENNARFLEEGRRKDLASVLAELTAHRMHALRALAEVGEVTPKVEEHFSESAYKHVDDHLPELRRFAERRAAK
ncbi:MAG: maleylpyruvate isomerase N-terminal domain-containing protein [Actinomycetota bacterium]